MDIIVLINFLVSAPEHLQRRMGEIPGGVFHVDDVLISGRDQDKHDKHLHAVLKRIQAAGLTLNRGTSLTSMVYLLTAIKQKLLRR